MGYRKDIKTHTQHMRMLMRELRAATAAGEWNRVANLSRDISDIAYDLRVAAESKQLGGN